MRINNYLIIVILLFVLVPTVSAVTYDENTSFLAISTNTSYWYNSSTEPNTIGINNSFYFVDGYGLNVNIANKSLNVSLKDLYNSTEYSNLKSILYNFEKQIVPVTCYQENTNSTTAGDGSCSLSYSGTYSSSGALTNVGNAYDKDWDTFAAGADTSSNYIIINYSKPTGALNATWQVKTAIETTNKSVPPICFNQARLVFRVNLETDPQTVLECYNGTDYINIATIATNTLYEEAVYWNTPVSIDKSTMNTSKIYFNGNSSLPYSVTSTSDYILLSEFVNRTLNLTNSYDNSLISNYTLTFLSSNGETFTYVVTDGKVDNILIPEYYLYNLTFQSTVYFPLTVNNVNLSNEMYFKEYQYASYQAEARFSATDRIGALITNFNVTIGSTTKNNSQPFYLNTGTYNATFSATGYINKTQEFNIATLSNTTYSFSETTERFNITFIIKNETTGSVLNGPTTSLYVFRDNVSQNVTTTTGIKTVTIDQNDDYYAVLFSATGGYTQRQYLFSMYNRSVSGNVTLYLLLNTTTTPVYIRVIDYSANNVPDAIVKIMKYNPNTGEYILEQILETDNNGQVRADLILYTNYYYFIVEYPLGTQVLRTTANFINSEALSLQIPTSSDLFQEYFTVNGITLEKEYDSIDNQFIFRYNDGANSVTQGCVETYAKTTTNYSLYNTSCTSGPVNTIVVPITNISGVTYTANFYAYVGGDKYFIDSLSKSFETITGVQSRQLLFWAGLLVLVFALVGLATSSFMAIALAPVPLILLRLLFGADLGIGMGTLVALEMCALMIAAWVSRE